MEEDQTVRFSLRIPKEMHERLTQAANESNQSLNGEMLRLLSEALDASKKEKTDKTLLEQLFSPSTIWRLKRYKKEVGAKSDEDAARRLLFFALEARDTTEDILEKLSSRHEKEKDLGILAKEIIAGHPLVKTIEFGNDFIWFSTKNNDSGAIDSDGHIYYHHDGGRYEDGMPYFEGYKHTNIKPSHPTTNNISEIDLDDEIPF